jgi:hypothetical protein
MRPGKTAAVGAPPVQILLTVFASSLVLHRLPEVVFPFFQLGFLMKTVPIFLHSRQDKSFRTNSYVIKFTQCSPKISPGRTIFFSILAMNLANNSSLPKTSHLTHPELMRNPGQLPAPLKDFKS